MKFPINRDYTDEQRLAVCEAIFNAEAWWQVAQHWTMFAPPPWANADERNLLAIRQFAFEWFTNYRIEAMTNDVKRLTPNPADFPDDPI